jgi:Kef-type K+ transport system membrane component KefB
MDMPIVPRIGMNLELPEQLNQTEWFGRGPFENYSDRKLAAKVGRYQSPVSAHYVPYVRPQENGYKTDVRWLSLTGSAGTGLLVRADELIGFSVHNNRQADFIPPAKIAITSEDGPDARKNEERVNVHVDDIVPGDFVSLNIDYGQMGVGGDDSWGKKTLMQYSLDRIVLGYGISLAFGFDWMTSILIGATLSATSIVISVTLLEELGKEKTQEGNILVNAAVLDDVLGLAVLSSVVSIIAVNSLPSIESVLITTGESLIFWLLLLLGAVFVLPKIIHGIAIAKSTSLEMRGTKQATALGAAFGFAAIASAVGLNPIVGAFAAGMGLAGSKLAGQVKEFVGELKIVLAPLFFAIIGAHVDLRQISEVNVIFFLVILAVAILSKVLGCGIPAAVLLRNRSKGFRIGFGMIARGEVAFITAGIGLASGILPDSIYTTLVLVILATIIITPILLKNSFRLELH